MFEWSIPSMKAIYNSRIIDQENIQISTNNRAFCYGDGLFETIVTGPNRINLIDGHIERLMAHSALLKFSLPKDLTLRLKEWIDELSILNDIRGDLRTKVQVWRKAGGLYTPLSNDVEFLITVSENQSGVFSSASSIGIAESITNQYSSISGIKSVNALNYVLAGIEKSNQNLDDIIILDNDAHLSETHISNLFWTKGSQIYTPSLKTGCISGVMRNFILDFCENELVNPVKEVLENTETLNDCDSIFSSNASGIRYFTKLEGREENLSSSENLLAPLIKRLQQP